MNQANRVYKNNILLSITILMCIHVLNAESEISSDNPKRNVTVSLHSHKNGKSFYTILKIQIFSTGLLFFHFFF